jgi:hypothetical protein
MLCSTVLDSRADWSGEAYRPPDQNESLEKGCGESSSLRREDQGRENSCGSHPVLNYIARYILPYAAQLIVQVVPT